MISADFMMQNIRLMEVCGGYANRVWKVFTVLAGVPLTWLLHTWVFVKWQVKKNES